MKDLRFYIGVKAIKAKPMTRGEWRALPRIAGDFVEDKLDGKNKDEEGYLVQYENSNNPNIIGYDKYVSWSPKKVFEDAYAKSDQLSIGLAFEAMRLGYIVKPTTCSERFPTTDKVIGVSLEPTGSFTIHFENESGVPFSREGYAWRKVELLLLDDNDYILDTWAIVSKVR